MRHAGNQGQVVNQAPAAGNGLARAAANGHGPGGRYKWVALSNTTLSMTMATIDASIVIISLPAIFRGIGLDPLDPRNVSYLLWMIMGYLLVTAVLVVSLGRLGDMYVPRELSVPTAEAIHGLRPWVTSEYEHDGLRLSNGAVLDRLIGLAQGLA